MIMTQGGLIREVVACWGVLNICIHDPFIRCSVRLADQCSSLLTEVCKPYWALCCFRTCGER